MGWSNFSATIGGINLNLTPANQDRKIHLLMQDGSVCSSVGSLSSMLEYDMNNRAQLPAGKIFIAHSKYIIKDHNILRN